MANIKLNSKFRTAIVQNAILDHLGTATMKVYDGTQAANAGDAATGNLLVTIAGITWNACTGGTSALTASKAGTSINTGTASWARITDTTSGTAYVIDGDCGTASSADFTIDGQVISSGVVVTLTAATIIQPSS